MTKIRDLLAAGRTYSFEFGPPRTPEAEERLRKTLLELDRLAPSFVSVTYGAGGSTRETTRRIVEHIARDTSMMPMPHLTCVGHIRAQLVDIITAYRDAGLENILALGGDPPLVGEEAPTDFTYATELIDVVREVGDFCIGAAAFPEGHPRSPSIEHDRRFLAEKLRQVDFGITQFFLRADDYFRMVDDLAALGVETPVLPGIMAFVNVAGFRRMAEMNATTIPDDLQARLDAVDGDPSAVRQLAVETCAPLIAELLERGAPGVHLYTMNYPTAAKQIWANLGIGPTSA
jgi:methylenetetrahydrofolate reductase (NADPH)